MAKPDNRKGDLAAIHMAQSALRLSTEDALALKRSVVGVESSADMSAAQRKRYLAHLSVLQASAAQARGEKPAYQPKRPTAASQQLANDASWHKASALWRELARGGFVRDDSDKALMAYTARQTRMEHWRFLNANQVNTVIESLKRWCKRVGLEVQHG